MTATVIEGYIFVVQATIKRKQAPSTGCGSAMETYTDNQGLRVRTVGSFKEQISLVISGPYSMFAIRKLTLIKGQRSR